ncbi:MAG: gamma-glutamyl-gamma-aminobutyrate hydrolase family protein [Anaerolineae bacterium]|nr:gamma-glutamyl-gamma-aminobutyrate hydrolase family protein [Anaerolineae bacterium]
MSKTPLIGITTYHRNENNLFTLPAQYVDAVRRAGAIPLLIPPGDERLGEILEVVDAVIVAGGGDIDPALYGGSGHETIYNVNAERDRSETALITKLIAKQYPTLCICRGIQMLNVTLGGTLIPHLPDVIDGTVVHRADPPGPVPHLVTVDSNSQLAKIMQADTVEVASWHHQGIDQVAPSLKVIARAADGVIEALEMPGNPNLLAVEWHPELTAAEDPTQQRIFDALVEMTRDVTRSQ